MSIITIVLITMLLPMIDCARPTMKLTFTPNDRYMSQHQKVEIQCEILNQNDRTDSPQLWYVNLKTGKPTPVSRGLLTAPTSADPEIFKTNRNNRYDFLKKGHIRIRSLKVNDSARYECNCPDCAEAIPKQTQDLLVMKLVEPTWDFQPGWPLHENFKATIRCETNDFYPHVGHQILLNKKDITNIGKSSVTNNSEFSQKFVWEATVTPTADWHDNTLRCSVTEGNTEQHTSINLDILFAAQLLTCVDRQFVDPKTEQSSIECSYAGNPEPQLVWHRKSDQKPITNSTGISVLVKNEGRNRYKSIVTFDRNALKSLPWTTTTTSPNAQGETSTENYYQQLLNKGFIVKLTVNGNEKATKTISITPDASQVRSNVANSLSTMSLPTILFFLFSLEQLLA